MLLALIAFFSFINPNFLSVRNFARLFTNPHWGGGIALGLAHQAALGKFKPSEEPKAHREFYGPSILVTKADADAFKKKYLDSTPKYDWTDRWGLSAGQIEYK